MLHIYKTDVESIVAESSEDARSRYCALTGETPLPGSYDDDGNWDKAAGQFVDGWEQLPDTDRRTLHVDDEGKIPECGYDVANMRVETRTNAEWAEHFGAGEFWSSEC